MAWRIRDLAALRSKRCITLRVDTLGDSARHSASTAAPMAAMRVAACLARAYSAVLATAYRCGQARLGGDAHCARSCGAHRSLSLRTRRQNGWYACACCKQRIGAAWNVRLRCHISSALTSAFAHACARAALLHRLWRRATAYGAAHGVACAAPLRGRARINATALKQHIVVFARAA